VIAVAQVAVALLISSETVKRGEVWRRDRYKIDYSAQANV
jgi:hypothetical protein